MNLRATQILREPQTGADFNNDAISREQVWLDGSSIAAQLTAPEAASEPG